MTDSDSAAHAAAVLADVRKKVKEMSGYSRLPGDDRPWIHRADVLAILDAAAGEVRKEGEHG